MPRTYICTRCGRTYSLSEFEKDRFCQICDTYLKYDVNQSDPINKGISHQYGSTKVGWLPPGYKVRKGQVEFIEEATNSIKNHEIFFGSAPCGVGKSLASLLAVLPNRRDGKLLTCFRTRSQLDIYLKELSAIGRGLSCASFISKRDMCPRRKTSLSYFDFLEECRTLRKNCETGTPPFCEFYMKMKTRRMEVEKLALNFTKKFLPPLEMVRRMSKRGFCAYEALKAVLSKVDIFLGTYHYAFDPRIRASLLKSLDADLSGVYIIVDEAHNLPVFSRELLSDQLTRRTVGEALRETDTFEHELVPNVQEYLETLDDDVFSRFQDVLEVKELRRVDPEGLSEIFQERCNSSGLEVAEIIHDYGEEVRETRQKLGHNRIYSYNHRVGEFLSNFFEKDSDRYLHLAHKDRRDRANMEVRCFDGRALTDPVLREAKGSILMSGFLSPIEVYRDLTLYDEKTTHLKEFNSPFPSENRLILVAKGISSRFKERTYATIQRWKEYIEAILEANQGNTAVFSTSYNLMHTILKQIETSRNVIVEKPKTRRQTLLKQLSRTSQNALFGVMGGKFSEGIDYPGKLLTCVVAVGLPYATWDVYQSAMISYYNKRYPERGRLHAYITPAILRLVQACGRVHRSERDKGCIAILDERVINPKIKHLLPNYFQKEMKIISNPNEALNQIEEFWREHYNFN